MKSVINLLAISVRRHPIITIVAVIAATFIVASFSSQIVMADANEGFAPDAEELTAAEEIGEVFGDESSSVVLQVIVATDDGDVLSAEGLETVQQISSTIESSEVAADLQQQEGTGAVVSFLAPLEGQAGGNPTVRVVVSGDDVVSPEGLEAVNAIQQAVFESPAAAKLDTESPQGPFVSFMAPLASAPGQGPTIQIVVDAGDGDVFTAEGLQTSNAVQQAVFSSIGEKLLDVPDQSPITTFLLPVDVAIAQGALPADADTEAIKQAYLGGQADLPPEVAGFLPFLVSNDADLEAATAAKGLITVNLSEPATPDEVAELASAVAGLSTPFSARVLDPGATGEDFKTLYADRLAFLPADVAPFLDFLMASDRDRVANVASKGLVVANLTEPLTADEEAALADMLTGVDVDGITVGFTPAVAPTTEELKAGYRDGLAFIPAEQAGVVSNLLGADRDMDALTASHGLMLVFLTDAPADEQEAFGLRQQALADQLAGLDLPEGFEAKAFSFGLIFASGGDATAEIGRMFGLAGAIILVILLFNFWYRNRIGLAARRTGAETALTLVTIFLAIGFMQGAGVLLGPKYLGVIGDFNQIVQILPILLIGLGVDYGIHMTFRYREEVGHESVDNAIQAAIKTVGVALVLATVTTAVGFLTNLVSPVPALKDFGILAAVGIVASFVLMLTFVPAVRELLDRRAERAGRLPKAALGAASEASGSLVGAVLAGIIGGVFVYAVSAFLDSSLNETPFGDSFQPVGLIIFMFIGAAVGGILVYLPKIVGPTAKLATHAAIPVVIVGLVLAGVGEYGRQQLSTEFSFTDFVPSDNPLLESLDLLTEEFGGGFGESTSVLVKGDVETAAFHNAQVDALENLADTEDVVLFGGSASADSVLSVIGNMVNPQSPGYNESVAIAAADAGLGADLRVSADADVGAIYGLVEEANPEGFAAVVNGDASLWSISTQAGDARAGELNTNLREAFAPVTAQDGSAVPTSNDIIGDVVVKSLQESQLQSLLITLAAATLLLVVNFWIESRQPLLGVITMLPVGLVVLLTFGMMALTGIPFGPVTATISALAIGIGVPYTIHITHRFQEDRVRYETTESAIRSTTLHTGGALAGSAMTTMAGFGSLVTSNLTPFRQFGAVTFYAIAFALLTSLLLLPSMLVLWDQWHKRRGDTPHVPIEV